MLKRKQLDKWFVQTVGKKTLIAPRKVDDVLLYRKISDTAKIEWDYVLPVLSAKEAFFPSTERLLTIEKTGQTIEIEEVVSADEQVVFGIRPCDARGIAAMDALFIHSEPVDQNYTHRREKTTVIGVACNEMADTCFCTSVGGAPDDPTGMDIMLKEVDGGFEVFAITEMGEHIVNSEWGIDISECNNSPITTHKSQFKIPDKKSWPPQFNDEFWVDMSERCLSCRICAYVCPTCRCFDVRDEVVPSENGSSKYERVRCWDSCAGEVYRRIAGGHNPREEKGQRLRNRFFCKFYYYPEQYRAEACTGCGRCIDYCPVNIDITEVIRYMMEVSS